MLTREAQLLHGYRVRAWKTHADGPDNAPLAVRRAGKRSLDLLIRTNLRLVVSLAKKFTGRGLELDDLIQEGNMGLIRGIEMYDPTRGYALSTYCFWWIKQGLTRAIYNQARMVRMPVNALEQVFRIERFIDSYTGKHGKPPSLEVIATEVDMSASKVLGLLEARTNTATLSFDTTVNLGTGANSTNNLIDVLASPEDVDPLERLCQNEYQDWMEHALAQLKPQEAYLIRRVRIEGATIVSASNDLGISRSRGTQILHTAIRRMRVILLLDGFSP